MGLRQRLGTWFGGRRESGERAEPEESANLEELQRRADAVAADLHRMRSLIAGGEPESPAVAPRFTSVEEARAYLERVRALLKR